MTTLAIARSISTVKDAPTPPTSRRPKTPEARLAREARVQARRPSCVTRGQCSDGKPQRAAVGFQIVEAKDVYYQPSWRTAIEMVDQNLPGSDAITLGADKTYDTPRICRDLPGAQCHSTCRCQ